MGVIIGCGNRSNVGIDTVTLAPKIVKPPQGCYFMSGGP
jgi:hypothetical protein